MKTNTLFILLLGLSLASVCRGQTSLHASGGNAQGTGGSVAYSIGQVAYHTWYGTEFNVFEGVQHPYELSGPVGRDLPGDWIIKVYPNPVRDHLKVEWPETPDEVHYELISVAGKVVQKGSLTGTTTSISLPPLSEALYLLHLISPPHGTFTYRIFSTTTP